MPSISKLSKVLSVDLIWVFSAGDSGPPGRPGLPRLPSSPWPASCSTYQTVVPRKYQPLGQNYMELLS